MPSAGCEALASQFVAVLTLTPVACSDAITVELQSRDVQRTLLRAISSSIWFKDLFIAE